MNERVIRFGYGSVIVGIGEAEDGFHYVQIGETLDARGVGVTATQDEFDRSLRTTYLRFPTLEQAQRVYDALTNGVCDET